MAVAVTVAASAAGSVKVAGTASCLCVFAVRSCDGVMSNPRALKPRPRLLQKLQLFRGRLTPENLVAVWITAEAVDNIAVTDGEV